MVPSVRDRVTRFRRPWIRRSFVGTLDQSLPQEYARLKTDGDRLLEEGDYAPAKLKLEAALEQLNEYVRNERDLIQSRLFEANRNIMEQHLEQGKALQESGDEEGAEEAFAAALDAAPDQTARDRVRLAQDRAPGDEEQSGLSSHLRRLYQAVQDNPENPDNLYNFGVELALDGYYDAAAAQFERVVELTQDNTEAQGVAYFRLGNLYQELERTEEAQEAFSRALEQGFDAADVYYRLGTLYEWRNDDEKARENFLLCLEHNPDHVAALTSMGASHEEQEEFAEALDYFMKVVELDPEDSETLYRIGMIYVEVDDTENAIKVFEQILEVDPDSDFGDDAQARLEELRG